MTQLDSVVDSLRRFADSVRFAVSTRYRTVATAAVSVVSFVVLVTSAYPRFTMRMVAAGPVYFVRTFRTMLIVLAHGSGGFDLALIVLYATLTGVLFVVVTAQLRGQKRDKLFCYSGVLPGLLLSGCASCGAGVLGLLGATGAITLLPFHGNGLRVLGIVAIAAVLARTGDPGDCQI